MAGRKNGDGREFPEGFGQLALGQMMSFLELQQSQECKFRKKNKRHIFKRPEGERNHAALYFRHSEVMNAFAKRNAEYAIGYELDDEARQIVAAVIDRARLGQDCAIPLQMCVMKTAPGEWGGIRDYLEKIAYSIKRIFGNDPPAMPFYEIAGIKRIDILGEIERVLGKLNALEGLLGKKDEKLQDRLESLRSNKRHAPNPLTLCWKAIANEMDSISKNIASNTAIILGDELGQRGFDTVYKPLFRAKGTFQSLIERGKEMAGMFDTVISDDKKSVLAGLHVIKRIDDGRGAVFDAYAMEYGDLENIQKNRQAGAWAGFLGYPIRRFRALQKNGNVEISEMSGWSYKLPAGGLSLSAQLQALPLTEIILTLKEKGKPDAVRLDSGLKARYVDAVFFELKKLGFEGVGNPGSEEYLALRLTEKLPERAPVQEEKSAVQTQNDGEKATKQADKAELWKQRGEEKAELRKQKEEEKAIQLLKLKKEFPEYELRVFRDPPLRMRLFLNGVESKFGQEAYSAYMEKIGNGKFPVGTGITIQVSMPPQPSVLIYQQDRVLPMPPGEIAAKARNIEKELGSIAKPDVKDVCISIQCRIRGAEPPQKENTEPKRQYNRRQAG